MVKPNIRLNRRRHENSRFEVRKPNIENGPAGVGKPISCFLTELNIISRLEYILYRILELQRCDDSHNYSH